MDVAVVRSERGENGAGRDGDRDGGGWEQDGGRLGAGGERLRCVLYVSWVFCVLSIILLVSESLRVVKPAWMKCIILMGCMGENI